MSPAPDPKNDTDNRPLPEQEALARALDGAGAAPVGPAVPAPTMPPKIGDNIGKYKIVAIIGTGACGRVYRGYDEAAKREVAIKVLRDEVITTENRENLLREFQSEASTVANLQGQNICPIYEVGNDAGRPYIIMPYVAGGTLKLWMEKSPIPPQADALTLIQNLARGLHGAHQQDIVHRDIKPANILCPGAPGDWKGVAARVLISDFGLAKVIDATLTMSAHKGTPRYMAPEQWRPAGVHKVGPLSDVYSLGVILFELLTGAHPFHEADMDPMDAMALAAAVCFEKPRTASAVSGNISAGLDALCAKALQWDPNDRYDSADDFANAVEVYLRTGVGPEVRLSASSGQRVLIGFPPAEPAVRPAPPRGLTAAERRHQAELDFQRGEACRVGDKGPRDPRAASTYYERAAHENHAGAQFQLGRLYESDDLGPPDYAKAREWYERAAKQRNPDALWCLSLLCRTGSGGAADALRAGQLAWQAAEAGHCDAQFTRAEDYVRSRDYPKACEWFKKAAHQGHAQAAFEAGSICASGRGGVKQDHAEARRWWELAANLDHPHAQHQLALLYYHGRGAPRDYELAHDWYERAAALGHPPALYNLGLLYLTGRGCEENPDTARALLERAALSGIARAREALRWLDAPEVPVFRGDYHFAPEPKPAHRALRRWAFLLLALTLFVVPYLGCRLCTVGGFGGCVLGLAVSHALAGFWLLGMVALRECDDRGKVREGAQRAGLWSVFACALALALSCLFALRDPGPTAEHLWGVWLWLPVVVGIAMVVRVPTLREGAALLFASLIAGVSLWFPNGNTTALQTFLIGALYAICLVATGGLWIGRWEPVGHMD